MYAKCIQNFDQISQRKEATFSAWEMGCENFDWLHLALDIEQNSKPSHL
jgi:hypothetical protein